MAYIKGDKCWSQGRQTIGLVVAKVSIAVNNQIYHTGAKEKLKTLFPLRSREN
jgi:hypothetical protein